MKKRIALLSAALFALMLLLPAFASAFAGYSADVVTYSNRKEQMTGKIYVSGKKVRMEAGQAVTIARLDKKAAWILMPAQKMYMETALRPQEMAAAEKVPGEVKRQYLGEESVEGRAAKKYRITYVDNGKTWTVYSWIDDAMGVPVKVSDENGKWMVVYRNLKPGSQPADLFEIPAGYKKMPSFGLSDIFKGGRMPKEGQGEEQAQPQNAPPQQQQQNKDQGGIKLPGGIKIPKLW